MKIVLGSFSLLCYFTFRCNHLQYFPLTRTSSACIERASFVMKRISLRLITFTELSSAYFGGGLLSSFLSFAAFDLLEKPATTDEEERADDPLCELEEASFPAPWVICFKFNRGHERYARVRAVIFANIAVSSHFIKCVMQCAALRGKDRLISN